MLINCQGIRQILETQSRKQKTIIQVRRLVSKSMISGHFCVNWGCLRFCLHFPPPSFPYSGQFIWATLPLAALQLPASSPKSILLSMPEGPSPALHLANFFGSCFHQESFSRPKMGLGTLPTYSHRASCLSHLIKYA